MDKDIKNLDVVFEWQDNEKYLDLEKCKKIPAPEMYNPFFYKNPWTKALEGKRVLVISPFTNTILKQYEKRKQLFENEEVLPDFELMCITSYNVLRGLNTYSDIESWFDALDIMKKEIDQVDFDIALLGCGAYAFNLAAYIKEKNRTSITMCGSLQTLFGIYGERYEKTFREKGIINEFWVRPDETERPSGFKQVENGAYW